MKHARPAWGQTTEAGEVAAAVSDKLYREVFTLAQDDLLFVYLSALWELRERGVPPRPRTISFERRPVLLKPNITLAVPPLRYLTIFSLVSLSLSASPCFPTVASRSETQSSSPRLCHLVSLDSCVSWLPHAQHDADKCFDDVQWTRASRSLAKTVFS